MFKRILVAVSVLVLAILLVDSVDAQRRRRRRRAEPQRTEQTPDAGTSPIEENPFDEPGQGTTQASPPAAQQAAPGGGEGAGGTTGGGEGSDAPPASEGNGSAEAPAGEAAEEGGDPYAPIGPDLEPLRTEFTSIMDELVNVRSRMAVLGRQLFHTKIRVAVHNRAGDDNTLSRIVVALDGAPVHRGDGSDLGEDVHKVFEGFAAPGPHVLTVEVEQRQRADDDYRYTTRDSFRFEVQRERLTDVTIVLDDDSDMGDDFEDDGEAEYDVNTRVRVATRELGD